MDSRPTKILTKPYKYLFKIRVEEDKDTREKKEKKEKER
jgi:hypothetical protein